ncbi:hypothetical protein HU200_011325 [Digitaria exilis]|uniref:Uncharacterized protein n=1 Tax=Digitaria exilis TaxID=1010633 RepID=A0A835FGB2_9POAL|nr:hypothetical protein HU200_011325 [Digitaria exilis]
MEIRAPPTSLRLAPPPASASFRRTALKSSFINGSGMFPRIRVVSSSPVLPVLFHLELCIYDDQMSADLSAMPTSLIDYQGLLRLKYVSAVHVPLHFSSDMDCGFGRSWHLKSGLRTNTKLLSKLLMIGNAVINYMHFSEKCRYRRAQLALQKGDEDLAREALKRRKSYADNASSLRAQLDQQKGVVENLISNTKLLESKIAEAKQKKDTLKARAQSAKTATKVSEMLGNVNTSSALSAFEKMEEKVMAMESQAEALGQLATDDLEGKFALLETSSVDDDLAQMKKELSGSSLKGELPPGRTAASNSSAARPFPDLEIESELNELRRKAKEY